MQLIIDQQQAQAILNYLIKQPYGEVANLVMILQRLQPVQPQKPALVEKDNKPGDPPKEDVAMLGG